MLALLGDLLDALRRDVQHEQAARRSPGDEEPLRTSQLRLLSLTPAQGMRVTDLAERLGMTKQALGEFATALEQRRLLESVSDPADRRVRILRPTEHGLRAVAEGEDVVAAVESRWRERLGPQRWADLRHLLREAAGSVAGLHPR